MRGAQECSVLDCRGEVSVTLVLWLRCISVERIRKSARPPARGTRIWPRPLAPIGPKGADGPGRS
jgi:hypothetical protein